MVEEKLIEAVKEHQELYDTKHTNYMKTKLKNGIWENIANDLNIRDGEEAKTIWLKLRNSYRDARRRQIKCIKSGVSPKHIKPWRFQKQMMFLENVMSAGYREGNVNDSDDELKISSALPVSEEMLDSDIGEGNHSYEMQEQPNNTDVETDNIEDSSTKTTLAQTPVAYSKQLKNRRQTIMRCLLKRTQHQREERTKHRVEERRKLESRDNPTDDPLYNFFISMYQLTRKMPAYYQHRVRSQLFQAVSKSEEIMNIPNRQIINQLQALLINHSCLIRHRKKDNDPLFLTRTRWKSIRF